MRIKSRIYDNAVMMTNLMLILAYDGTDFHGWQFQPGERTVQEALEQALRRALRHRVAVIGCSRTDSGVHAAGYVANLFTTNPAPKQGIARSIGSRLPKDMTLVHLEEVPLTFHATWSAKSKLYRYRIHNAVGRPVEEAAQRFTYHCWQRLSVDDMREAARIWVGHHDFSSFASAGNQRRSNVRTVYRIEVNRIGQEIQIDVEGDGFLYKQVRNMVGSLLEVGRGHRPIQWAQEVLDAKDRRKAGPTAPARGLTLQWVRYNLPDLPPPTPQMLDRAQAAKPPAGAQRANVDQKHISTAPMPPNIDMSEEPCA